MTTRRTSHPLSASGYSLTLDSVDDLAALDEGARACIGDTLEALLSEPRREFERISLAARYDTTRALCAALMGRPVAIEVHVADPADTWSADTLARFGGAESEWRIALRGPLARVAPPASCPASLREFYAFFGGLDLRYGWSGRLVRPTEIRDAHALLAEHGVDDTSLLAAARELDAHGFYEVDGDWLCWLSNREAAWLGDEWNHASPLEPVGQLDATLARLFASAARGERFHR